MDPNLQKILSIRELLSNEFEDSINSTIENLPEQSFDRMQIYSELTAQKLETKRKKKLESELSTLRDRPLINSNSNKFVPNYIPLHKRVDTIIKNRNEYIKTLQLEAEMRKRQEEHQACSFRPNNSRIKPRSRPVDFSEKAKSWLVKAQERKEKLVKEQEASLVAECSHSPVISKVSKRIAEEKIKGSVVNRLYTPEKVVEIPEESFRPNINPKSMKIKRPSNVFDRLYRLRRVPEAPSKVEVSKTPTRSHISEFTINTSRGAIFKENEVSLVSYTPELQDILQSLTPR